MTAAKRIGLVLLTLLLCAFSLSGRGGVGDDRTARASGSPRGKLTFSVLGDSISSFEGLSNGLAADFSNSTIRLYEAYYRTGTFGLTAYDTWWEQAADAVGLTLLVNNSWSGSYIFSSRPSASDGCSDRCVQLHDNVGENAGQEPDIIAVYLGTNDLLGSPDTLGRAEDVDYGALAQELPDGRYSYSEPTTAAEAYAIMLHRITHRYPDAQTYCFTIPRLAVERAEPERINSIIRAVAREYGAVVVDLYADSGITGDLGGVSMFYGDGQIHPNERGMTAIADCFAAALRKNVPQL